MPTELEDRLRAAMESAVAGEQAPANLAGLVSRRHRRHVARAVSACVLAIAAAAAAIPLTLAALTGGHGQPRPAESRPPVTPSPQVPPRWLRHLRPSEESGPLYTTEMALSAAGHERQFGGLYATIVQDPPHKILLFVTDPAEVGQLESAARKRDHALDTAAIQVLRVRYSLRYLSNASSALLNASLAKRLPFAVNGVSYCGVNVWPVCGGLQVLVTDPAAAERLAAERMPKLGRRTVRQFLGGVQLTFVAGTSAPL